MSFNIEFDYRFDTNGFFTSSVRAALEEAAQIWENLIQDEFPNFEAGQTLTVTNPQTGQSETVTINQEIDDLLIFVGARNLGGSAGLAGPSVGATGDENQLRVANDFRGQGPATNFEPYMGTVAFDPSLNWSFDVNGPVPGQLDFVTVALHEIGHVLGFGTSAVFNSFVANDLFSGPNALAANGGAPVPLDPSLHVQEGFMNNTVLLDPVVTVGTRVLPSSIDLALLADIGYEINGFVTQGTTFEIATSQGETIFGRDIVDTINGLGGDDQIIGRDGDDHLQGGAGTDTIFGEGGLDSFYFSPGDGQSRINDFDFGNELIVVDPAFGLTTAAEVLNLVTSPFSNVREIVFGNGPSAFIFTNGTGTELTEANIAFGTLGGLASPTEGNDTLVGTSGNDTIDGLGGDDTIDGVAGNDTLTGGAGADALDGGVGNDTASYVGVERSGSGGYSSEHSDRGHAAGDTMTGIENLIGSAFGDVLSGGNDASRLEGGDGADELNGNVGDDVLIGGLGADDLNGGTGSGDVADYSGSAVGVDAGVDNGAVNLGGEAEGDILLFGGIENLIGSAFDDILTGNSVLNTLTGGAGADMLNGGGNTDILLGGDGDDKLIGGNGADTINGGAGFDIASYVNAGARLFADMMTGQYSFSGNGAGDTLTSIEQITGTRFDDFLYGNGAANVLDGYLGDDLLLGRGGNDTLRGFAGDDRLNGGTANDTLTGSTGVDTFLFDSAAFGQDTITDFGLGGAEVMDMRGSGWAFADAMIESAGGNTTITFAANATITLSGISGGIDANDFMF